MIMYAPDGLSGGGDGGNSMADIQNTLNKVAGTVNSQAQAQQAQQSPDGLEEREAELAEVIKNLDAHTKNLFEELTSGNDKLRELQEETQRILGEKVQGIAGGGDKENGKASSVENTLKSITGDGAVATKDNPKPSDLLKLKAEYALGPLLLYYKLDAIEKKMGGEKKDASGGGKIKDIFSNLLKGVGSLVALAAALTMFAVSANLFAFTDWGKALTGLVMFSGFIISSVLIANLLDANADKIKKLGIGAMYLSIGFAVFGIAFKILDSLDGKWGRYILALGFFTLFIGGAAAVSIGASAAMPSFINFGIAAILLATSFIVFAIALNVIDTISKTLKPQTFLTLGLITLVILGVAAISALMSSVMPAFFVFSIGSILFSLGLILFGKALEVVNKIQNKDLVDGAGKIIKIAVLLTAVSLIGAIGGAGMIGFAVMSVLFAVGIGLFFIATLLLNRIDFATTLKSFRSLAGTLVIMNTTMIAMLAVSLVGAVAMVPFLAFSLMFMTSMLSFWAATSILNRISFASITSGIGKLTAMSGLVAASSLLGLASLVALPLCAPFILWSGLVLGSIVKMVDVLDRLNNLDMDKSKLTQKLDMLNSLIHGISDSIHIRLSDLASIVSFNIAMEPLAKAFNNVVSFLDDIKTISSSNVSADSLMAPMNAIKLIVSSVGGLADSFSGGALVKITMFNKTIGLLADAIGNVAQTIVTLQSFDESMVKDGTGKIKVLMEGLFSDGADDGSHWSFTTLFNRIGKVSKNAINASKVIAPMAQGISAIADTIVKLDGIQNVQENVAKMLSIGTLFANLDESIREIARLNKGRIAKAGEALESMNSFIPQLISFRNSLANVGDFEPMKQLFQIFPNGFDGFTYYENAVNVSKGIAILNKGFEKFHVENINALGESLGRISANVDVSSAIDPIIALIEKKDALKEVVASLEKMAEANKKISVNRSVFGSIESLDSPRMPSVKKVNSSKNNGIDGDDPASIIASLLIKWNESGIPVKEAAGEFKSSIQSDEAKKKATENSGILEAMTGWLPFGMGKK